MDHVRSRTTSRNGPPGPGPASKAEPEPGDISRHIIRYYGTFRRFGKTFSSKNRHDQREIDLRADILRKHSAQAAADLNVRAGHRGALFSIPHQTRHTFFRKATKQTENSHVTSTSQCQSSYIRLVHTGVSTLMLQKIGLGGNTYLRVFPNFLAPEVDTTFHSQPRQGRLGVPSGPYSGMPWEQVFSKLIHRS
jgi:hypothetical protein